MNSLAPSTRDFASWLVAAATALAMVAVVGLMLWLVPSTEDRFNRCMALAERAGLLQARREDAALICLDNATRRLGRGGDGGPIIIPSTTGDAPIVIP